MHEEDPLPIDDNARDHDEWLGSTVEYEGFPMALRIRPRADTKEHRARLRHLAAVTHALAHVRSSGLPEPDYNDDLADLDSGLITALEAFGSGLTVIVETFAGKRTYYAYVTSGEHAQRVFADTTARFPEHDLSLAVRMDEDWGLYDEYRRLFPW